jgi:hypothetical protein
MRPILLMLWITAFASALVAQQENNDPSPDIKRHLYENALLQVENLILTQSMPDSVVYYLLSDAKNFASEKSWDEGYEILKAIIAIYGEDSVPKMEKSKVPSIADLPDDIQAKIADRFIEYPAFPFQLEVGVDYSLQEFELSFVENDSTIVEELQNPYVGLLFSHSHHVGNNQVTFHHRFRLDDQFIYYSLFGSYQSDKIDSQNRLDFETYYYHQAAAEYSDFFDGRIRYNFSRSDYTKRLFHVNLQGRYKAYFKQDSLNNDIFSTALNTYYEHFFNPSNSLYVNIVPELYAEQKDLGLSYFQTRAAAFYRMRKNYNQYFEIGSDIVYRDFKDSFSDEEYKNIYFGLEPRLQGELSFNSSWGVGFMLEMEKRSYRMPDDVNPDFIYFTVEGVLKYFWEDFKSVGVGYFYERQSHSVDDVASLALVELENFYTHGLIVDSEIMNFSGLLLSLEYRLSLRTYPNADASASLFYNYYSNRFVHSISAFGWIPIGTRWQVQLFANYDNDQDRDNELNDNRSTIVNLGLIYKF